MKKRLFPFLLISVILVSCLSPRKIIEIQTEAANLYANGAYKESFEKSESGILMLKTRADDYAELYNIAGLSAHALGNTRHSIDYLEKAIKNGGANEDTYSALADNYRRIDNLSKEISVLESYIEKHPEGKEISNIRSRLFIIQVDIDLFDQADQLWRQLYSRDLSDEELLSAGLRLNRHFERTESCDELARKILSQNNRSMDALDWLARRHYWMAENRYQAEMKAYEFNRTRTQYARLLEAFKVLNEDFKIALNHFQKLYELKPEKEYAHFIGNIYLRFEDKQKASYWHEKSNQ
jgi:tetratricopeptide (TPR) repeat protein